MRRLLPFVFLFVGCAPLPGEVGSSEAELVVCGSGGTVEGIDVSSWQGDIDWGAVAGAGIRYAIVRISDGGYRDRYFAANWSGARDAGLIRGAYQFFRPDQDPIAQADIVVAAVGRLGPNDLPVTCDVEAPGPTVSPAEYTRRLHLWVDRVTEGTGRPPMIYTGRYYWDPYVASSDFTSLPLWHAQYTSAACPNINDRWASWTFWQYTSTGSVAGIAGNVDRNRFNGSMDELMRLASSNRRPIGWLDGAGCTGITGWAQDPDAATSPIDVHVYLGGPAGDPAAVGIPTHAAIHRDDLCGAIGSCEHGFSIRPPLSFFDGLDHPVYAYGIDAMGGENALLSGAPLMLRCDAVPPMPAGGAVRRHVPSPDVLAAWSLGFVDVAPLSDAALDAIFDGPRLSPAPHLVQVTGEPAVYLLEGDVIRHVPSPEVMEAWRFSFGVIEAITTTERDALLEGPPVLDAPFLARGTGPAVYLVDAAPPLWAELLDAEAPARLAAGRTTLVTFRFTNRGSIAWASGATFLAPTPRDEASELCDPSWPSCTRAATVSGDVAPGGVGTFAVRVLAPTTLGTTTLCVGLVHDGHWFSDPSQNGPADDSICRTFEVVAASTPDVDPGTDPGTDAGTSPGARSTVSGGCSAGRRGGSAIPLALVALAVLARRCAR